MNRRILGRNPFGRILFSPDTGTETPNGGTQDPPNDAPLTKHTVRELIEAILASKRVGGDENKALEVFAGQVLAKDARILELTNLVGKLPDDVQALKAFVDEQGGLEKLKKRLNDGDAAVAERDTMKREGTLREACELAGIDYNDLSTRKGVDDWSIEVEDETKDGKTVKVAYVTVNGADGKPETKPLAEKAFAAFPTLAKAGAQQIHAPNFDARGGDKPGNEFDELRRRREEKNKAEAQQSGSWMEKAGVARKS